jgi:TolB-like protein/tetratricopeptide (TPR) repeat protein
LARNRPGATLKISKRPRRCHPLEIFKELQRRNVFRVALGYIVSSWLLAQVADLVLENIGSPEWVMQSFMLLLALGFPVVVFFSWAFEVTPEGIKRESEIDHSQSITHVTGRKLDRAIFIVLLVALAYFAYDKFILDPQRDAALVEDMEQAGIEQESTDPIAAEEKLTERDGPPMLAVLPFVSANLEGDSEFFATGVHDDLLTQLAQLQSIRVISRTSVLEYKDTTSNIREIGKELGADAILEGGVQSAGQQIRINAQLIDARTDEHLWAQTYDRELTPANIFEVQTEIARAITSALQTTLTVQDNMQLNVLPTENMAAYRAYHRALEIRDGPGGWSESEADAFRQALEEAVTLDPTFTRAWAELAGNLSFTSFFVKNPEAIKRAEQILEKIQTLAPNSADLFMAQSYYAYYVLKDFQRAHQLITQAQEMRPSDARVVELKSWIERRLGDHEAKIESIRLARKLDPRNPKWTTALVRNLILAHRYEEAGAEIKNSAFQNYDLSYWQSMLRLRQDPDFGRWAETVEALQKEFSKVADPLNMWEAHIANRDYAAAEQLTSAMKTSSNFSAVSVVDLSDRKWTQIVTYWFMQRSDRLEELLDETRVLLEKGLNSDDIYANAIANINMALVTAIEGNSQETARLVRSWRREAANDLAWLTNSLHESCRVLGIAGANEAAIGCIRDGLAQPSYVMPFVEPILPYYDSIRDEPAFVELLSELDEAATQR